MLFAQKKKLSELTFILTFYSLRSNVKKDISYFFPTSTQEL